MSDKSESTYVWRRINRAKLPLILDDDGDWVANLNIGAAYQAAISYVAEHGGRIGRSAIKAAAAAALIPGDTDEQ